MTHASDSDVIQAVLEKANLRDDGAASTLRDTGEVRRRARALLVRARAGESAHFTVDDTRLVDVETLLVQAAKQVGKTAGAGEGRRRLDALLQPAQAEGRGERIERAERAERARAHVDLAFVTELLRFTPPPTWALHDATTDESRSGSQGVALAAFNAFAAGLFSSDPARPLQVDAAGLRAVRAGPLRQAFQCAAEPGPQAPDPLEARLVLLRRIGEALAPQLGIFGPGMRPAGLFDVLTVAEQHELPPTAQASAPDVLATLLMTLSPIWPAENSLGEHRLGDCWPLDAAQGPGLTNGWMPLHRLAQALTYAMVDAFRTAGVRVLHTEALTPLPFAHACGLLVDAGVLVSRQGAGALPIGHPAVVECRALTLALIDELAPGVHRRLPVDPSTPPLASLLDAQPWLAARRLALHLPQDGAAPTTPWVEDDPSL